MNGSRWHDIGFALVLIGTWSVPWLVLLVLALVLS
jgi:hypothetical protein